MFKMMVSIIIMGSQSGILKNILERKVKYSVRETQGNFKAFKLWIYKEPRSR